MQAGTDGATHWLRGGCWDSHRDHRDYDGRHGRNDDHDYNPDYCYSGPFAKREFRSEFCTVGGCMSQRGGAIGFKVDWGEYFDWGYGTIFIGAGFQLPSEYIKELPPTVPRKALGVAYASQFLQFQECHYRHRPLSPRL